LKFSINNLLSEISGAKSQQQLKPQESVRSVQPLGVKPNTSLVLMHQQ